MQKGGDHGDDCRCFACARRPLQNMQNLPISYLDLILKSLNRSFEKEARLARCAIWESRGSCARPSTQIQVIT